jgi:two-component system cell cycle sensor histidine kinase/response regulator CckA
VVNEDSQAKVLSIEDSPGDARLIREMLAGIDHPSVDLGQVDQLSIELGRLAGNGIDVILTNLDLPDSQGLDTFATLRGLASGVPIVMLTDPGDQSLAIQAVQVGVQDHLVKGEKDSHLLARALRYAIERKRAEQALRESKLEPVLSDE